MVELIRQRRAQMLVHSFLYYVLDDPIVPDDTWQRWANELAKWQVVCPQIGYYDQEFADWDGTTGMHLPQDDYVRDLAIRVARIHQEMTCTR